MANENNTKFPFCHRCGQGCILGYEVRTFGPRDPETGDQDEEIICAECLANDAESDDEYDVADMKFTAQLEDGRSAYEDVA